MARKKKVFKLDRESECYSLIAISLAESLHKAGWLINRALGIQLSESDTVRVPIGTESMVEFPLLKDDSSLPEGHITLIKNRIDGNILVKTLPNVDYLLKISGEFPPDTIKAFIRNLKSLPAFSAAVPINVLEPKYFRVMDGI